MTDTMRTIAQLETLLADNTAGDVSPQDLRDAIIATIRPGYAELSVTSSAATTLSDTSTWVQVAGTWALSDASPHWAETVNGRLYYTGAAAREVNVTAAVTMTVDGNLKQTQFAIGVDGVVLTPSIVQRYVSTGADYGAAAVVGHTDIANGSYICLMCRNITTAVDITAEYANIVVTDFAA